jgi:hypothetical protein
MRVGIHFFVDIQNLPVFADIDRPAKREFAFLCDDSIGFGHFFAGITQQGIVDVEFLGELLIVCRSITTGSKVGDVEFADFLATLTERLAFARSATGFRFGIPENDDRFLSFETR